jgi:hypothetical protein
MRNVAILLVLLLFMFQPAVGLAGLVPIPPGTLLPTDPDGDGKYEDLNANGRKDFADVTLFFNQMTWIAEHEPLAAFDFNGNGRIDFADVVALFNDLTATPTPTPTTGGILISQTVSPSMQEQIVRGGGVNVTIPGGALNETALVKVQSVASPPSPPAGTSNLTVYDITVGAQVRFDPALVIEIPFSPSMIPPGSSAEDVIRGVRWDGTAGSWRDVACAVDETRRVVVLESDHLCVEGFTVQLRAPPITEVEKEHFVVHFNSADDATIASSWAGAFTTARQMASAVATELEDAYNNYNVSYELKPPVPSRFSLDGKIHVYIGDYDNSEWGWFTKNIHIARTPFLPQPTGDENRAALYRELRHELFHAEENAWCSVDTMHVNRWWTEAWAEHASTYMYTGTPGTEYPLDAAFCKKPLTTVDGYHEYQTAHFVEKLRSLMSVSPGADPRFSSTNRLWTLTAAHGGSYDALDGVITAESVTSLADVYKEWIIAEIWGDHGGDKNWVVDKGLLDGSVEMMDLDTHHLELSVTVPAEGTCSVRGIRVTPPANDFRIVALSISEPFPTGVNAFFEELGAPMYERDGQFLHLTRVDSVMDEHLIYVVLTNTDDTPRHVTVSVDNPTLTANPGEPTVYSGIECPVQLVAENLPNGLHEFTFHTGSISSSSPFGFGAERAQFLEVPIVDNKAETVLYINTDGSPSDDQYVRVVVCAPGLTGDTFAVTRINYHVREV